MPRRAIALAVLVIAAGFAAGIIPYLARPRPISAGTAAGPPQHTPPLLMLRPGSSACQDGVALDEHTQVALVTVDPGGRPAPPLRFTALGPGFNGAPHTIPGGYTSPGDVTGPLETPRGAIIGQVCIQNVGHSRAAIFGTLDSMNGRGAPTIDGKLNHADLSLRLFESGDRSLASAAPVVLERAAAYKGPLIGRLTVWPLAALVLVGLPVLALLALREGLHGDRD